MTNVDRTYYNRSQELDQKVLPAPHLNVYDAFMPLSINGKHGALVSSPTLHLIILLERPKTRRHSFEVNNTRSGNILVTYGLRQASPSHPVVILSSFNHDLVFL